MIAPMARPRDIFTALEAGARIVVLHGKESYRISEGSRRYAAALEAEFGSLDRFPLDGRSAQIADVLAGPRTFAPPPASSRAGRSRRG